MLKGHVFKEQVFGNHIFALFINTFIGEKNGIIKKYKNGMSVTYNNGTLTIQSGVACIQGRFLEEDTSTDIVAGNDNAYCKLIIEINLDNTNTEEQLTQASYKVLKSTSSYPILTQTDIADNNAGIYQFELARFRTSSNGITDFKDTRSYLDFESIYAAMQEEFEEFLDILKQELSKVEDGSAFFLNSRFKIFKEEADDSQGKEGDIGIVWFEDNN